MNPVLPRLKERADKPRVWKLQAAVDGGRLLHALPGVVSETIIVLYVVGNVLAGPKCAN